jgi:hypothetical protein
MKTHHLTDEQIQTAIDAVCNENKEQVEYRELSLSTKSQFWKKEDPTRLHIAKEFLARLPEPIPTTMNFTPFTRDELAIIKSLMASQELDATQVLRQALRHYQMAAQGKPEPTPPVVDGKTPGQVAYIAIEEHQLLGTGLKAPAWEQAEAYVQEKCNRMASAVLVAFGQPSLEAAIARMEAVSVMELGQLIRALWLEQSSWITPSAEAVRARLIAAVRKGQGEAVDWKAKYEETAKERDKLKFDCDRMSEQEVLSLSQLRPIAESGDVPDGCVRVGVLIKTEGYVINPTMASPNYFADIRLPISAASQDSQPAESDPPAWQPAVGDTVRLNSGGDALTVTEYDAEKNQWRCVGLTGGCPCYLCVPLACLKPATKEEQP